MIRDASRFSLETLLTTKHYGELSGTRLSASVPLPREVWEARRSEFVEWPPMLAVKFPQLRLWDDRIVRLAQGSPIGGLHPQISPGSWMLLEKLPVIPDTRSEGNKKGWSQPIYVLCRGVEIFCGYLEREGNHFALLTSNQEERVKVEIPKQASQREAIGEKNKANSIRYQIKAMGEISVIAWLSDAGFLPRYGFPINLQKLSVRIPKSGVDHKSTTSEKYRLERQSLIALSEYVPGAVLLVGGKVLESKGILKHWTETNRDEALMLNYWALNCANGHEYLATNQSGLCPHCQMGPDDPGQMLMFPRFGYTTAAWDPPKPPGRKLDRIGEVEMFALNEFTVGDATEQSPNFSGIPGLTALYYEAGKGELLYRNAGSGKGRKGFGFAVCTRCGYAESERLATDRKGNPPPLPPKFREHPSIYTLKPGFEVLVERSRACTQK
jgi:hypothetical protein